MGMGQEFKDFISGFEAGNRIMMGRQKFNWDTGKTQLQESVNTPSSFDDSTPGSGVGKRSVPQAKGGFSPDKATIGKWTDYIKQGAAKRGMDPNVAVQVARSEGLREGVWQSNLDFKGSRETSYGPFQLFTGGGLGNAFQKETGLDPADPNNVYATIDFALDNAKKGGWGPWHGWKGDPWAGINPNTTGVNTSSVQTPTSVPTGAATATNVSTTAQQKGIPSDTGEDEGEEAPPAPSVAQSEFMPSETPEMLDLETPQVQMEDEVMFERGGAIPDDGPHYASGGGIADIYRNSQAIARQGAQPIGVRPTQQPQRNWGSSYAPPAGARPIQSQSTPAPAGVDPYAAAQQVWDRNSQVAWLREQADYDNGHGSAAPRSRSFRMEANRLAAQPWPKPAAQSTTPTPPTPQGPAPQPLPQAAGDWRMWGQTGSPNQVMYRNRQLGFAAGGQVPNFEEQIRRETRMSSGRAEEAGQGPRDMAARRLNMGQRGVDSTAMRSGPDPRSQFPARPSPFKTPPPRSGAPAPQTGGAPIPTPRPPPQQPSGPPGRLSDEYVRPSPQSANPPAPQQPQPQPQPQDDSGEAWYEDIPVAPFVSAGDVVRKVRSSMPQVQTPAGAPPAWMGGIPHMKRGGAIPDDDDKPVMRSHRAEDAQYQTPRRPKPRSTDPWEGMRTKTSEPVRKRKEAPSRNAGKRAKPGKGPRKPITTRGDDKVPTPTPRPDPTSGQQPPIPSARPPSSQPTSAPGRLSDEHSPNLRPTAPQPRPGRLSDEGAGPIHGTVGPGRPATIPPASPMPPKHPAYQPNVTSVAPRTAPNPTRPTPGSIPQGKVVRNLSNTVPKPGVEFSSGAPPAPYAPPDRGLLHAGMSTIADFLDMISPEDLARPVEDLQQLNIMPGAGGTPMSAQPPRQVLPGYRDNGAIPDDGR